jgi:hypothetical protein
MAIVLVQQISTSGSSKTGISIPVSGVTPGNCLVAFGCTRPFRTGGISFSDDAGGSWSVLADSHASTTVDDTIGYVLNSAGGTVTVSLNFSSSTSTTALINVVEFSGVTTVSPGTDGSGIGTGGTTSSPSTGSKTTSNLNDLILASMACPGTTPPTAGPTNGFTGLNNVSGGSGSSTCLMTGAFLITSVTGSYFTGWTLSSSIACDETIGALEAGAGGGGGGGLLLPIGSFTEDGPYTPLNFEMFALDTGAEQAWYANPEWVNFPLVNSWQASLGIQPYTAVSTNPIRALVNASGSTINTASLATSASGSISVNNTPGVQAGDVVVCTVTLNQNTTTAGSITAPDGSWTTDYTGVQNDGSNATWLFHKVAGASEPASYGFSFTFGTGTGFGVDAMLCVYRGGAFIAVDDVQATNTATASTTASAPSLNATAGDMLVVIFFVAQWSAQFSLLPGLAQQLNFHDTSVGSSYCWNDGPAMVSGATGTFNSTMPVAQPSTGISFALRMPASQVTVEPVPQFKAQPKLVATISGAVAATSNALKAVPKLVAALALRLSASVATKAQPVQTDSGRIIGIPATLIKAQPKLTDTVAAVLSAATSFKARPAFAVTSAIRIAGSAIAKASSLIVQASGTVFQEVLATAIVKLTSLGSPANASIKASPTAAATAQPKLLPALRTVLRANGFVKSLPAQISFVMTKLAGVLSMKGAPGTLATGKPTATASAVSKAQTIVAGSPRSVLSPLNSIRALPAQISAAMMKLAGSGIVKGSPATLAAGNPTATASAASKTQSTFSGSPRSAISPTNSIRALPALAASLGSIKAIASTAFKAAPAIILNPALKLAANQTAKLVQLIVIMSGRAIQNAQTVAGTAIMQLTSLKSPMSASIQMQVASALKSLPQVLTVLAAKLMPSSISMKGSPVTTTTGKSIASAATTSKAQPRLAGSPGTVVSPTDSIRALPALTASLGSIKTIASTAVKAVPALTVLPVLKLVAAGTTKLTSLVVVMGGRAIQNAQTVAGTAVMKLTSLKSPMSADVQLSPNPAFIVRPIIQVTSSITMVLAFVAKALPRMLNNPAVRAVTSFAAKARPALIASGQVLQAIVANMAAKLASLGSKAAGAAVAAGQAGSTVRPAQQSGVSGTVAGLPNIVQHPAMNTVVPSITSRATDSIKALPQIGVLPGVALAGAVLGIIGRSFISSLVQLVKRLLHNELPVYLFLVAPEVLSLSLVPLEAASLSLRPLEVETLTISLSEDF